MVRGGEGALSPFRQRRGRKVRKGPHGVRENAGWGGWKAGAGGGLRAPFRGGAGGGPPARSGRRSAAGNPARERMGKGVDTSPDAGACRNGRAPVAGRRRFQDCVPARVPREAACGIRCGAKDCGRQVCRTSPTCAGWRLPCTPPASGPSRCSRPGSSGRWSARHAVPSGAPSPVARQPRRVLLRGHSAPPRLLAIRS